MPFDQVMPKWKAGELHSGSKSGPVVKNQKQAVAIMLSEKKKADAGKKEYKSKPVKMDKSKSGPTQHFMSRFNGK